jgi:hypothetical protein
MAAISCFKTNAAVYSLTSATFPIEEKFMRVDCMLEGGL